MSVYTENTSERGKHKRTEQLQAVLPVEGGIKCKEADKQNEKSVYDACKPPVVPAFLARPFARDETANDQRQAMNNVGISREVLFSHAAHPQEEGKN